MLFYKTILLTASITAVTVFVLLAEASWRPKLGLVAALAFILWIPSLGTGWILVQLALQALLTIGVLLYFRTQTL